MSNLFDETEENEIPDELTILKERADIMGIKYHPSIGLEKLKEKVNTTLNTDTKVENTPADVKKDPPKVQFLPETIQARNTRLRKEANRLIRIRLTCMDPNKKNYPGEIFTVSNAVVGTVKKYVPYGAEEGYHVPHIIYEQLKTRKHQEFKKVTVAGGRKVMKSFLAKTFAIEVLDPLTPKELKELATRQALNHSIDQ